MHCPVCGRKELKSENYKFCPDCGTSTSTHESKTDKDVEEFIKDHVCKKIDRFREKYEQYRNLYYL